MLKLYENESLNLKIFLWIVIISLVLTFIFDTFLNLKVEYKFVNEMNDQKFSQAFSNFCDNNLKNINYKDFMWLLWEDKTRLIENFKVDKSYPIPSEMYKDWYLYWFDLNYNVVHKEYLIILTRVYWKSFYVKEIDNKKCIEYKKN